jgi:SHS2 domain-containing protein
VLAKSGWQHFPHVADIGVRGFGNTVAEAFENVALALTSIVTNLDSIRLEDEVTICCEAPDLELLLTDWLNAIVFEMSTRAMVFGSYSVDLNNLSLVGQATGERVSMSRHQPAAEVKGATLSELSVRREPGGIWLAQCIVDV